jgi:hypothetical protein
MAVHYSGIMLYSSKTHVTNFLSKTPHDRIFLHAKKNLNKHSKESTLDRCLLKTSL